MTGEGRPVADDAHGLRVDAILSRDSRPKVVYVAGPISAPSAWDREQNIRRAEAAALEVWRAGAAAICVHAACRFYDESEARASGWLAADLELLRRADALLLVEGWEQSRGSLAERDEAIACGIPVFASAWAMRRWLAAGAPAPRLVPSPGGASCP